jgi:hypothetical protein
VPAVAALAVAALADPTWTGSATPGDCDNKRGQGDNIRFGQNRKREGSREYAWFARTDSGIIALPGTAT